MNKYEIIAVDIREDILKGIYKPNEKLPFEKEICSKYNASKMTVKKSIRFISFRRINCKKAWFRNFY